MSMTNAPKAQLAELARALQVFLVEQCEELGARDWEPLCEQLMGWLPEFEQLRDQARDVKNHVLAHLDYYLERFEAQVTAARAMRAEASRYPGQEQQIMELYLNQIFLGRNAYGVQSASRAYFNKDVADLSLNEMAFLAILPKAPETYGRAKNEAKALERRDYVLREMLDNDFINEAQYRQARTAPLGLLPHAATVTNLNMGGYFLEEVRRELIGQFGENSKAGPYSVYDGGLWVRTSLNPDFQTYAEQALRDGLVRYDSGKGWRGPIATIETGPGWAGRLAAQNLGAGYPEWRIAVVLGKAGAAAQIGFADGSMGTLPASGAVMPRRGTATAAFNAMKAGDIIAVKREGGEVIAEASLVDRSNGSVDLGVPFFPLIRLDVPTYEVDKLPPELAAIPAVKPGSRKADA